MLHQLFLGAGFGQIFLKILYFKEIINKFVINNITNDIGTIFKRVFSSLLHYINC